MSVRVKTVVRVVRVVMRSCECARCADESSMHYEVAKR